MEPSQKEFRLAAVMFIDIHGFRRLLESSETDALSLLEDHDRFITTLAGKHRGAIIKSMGDTFLVEFNSTIDAVKCAVDIQEQLYAANKDKSENKRYRVRIGIHLGDIWFFENDALGEGVTIASRLQSLSKPGGICISRDVYNQIKGNQDLTISELGKVELKEINKEVFAYEILTRFSEQEKEKESAPAQDKLPGQKIRAEKAAIQNSIIDHIKLGGRHIPLGEIQNIFPDAGQKVSSILGKLTDRGILTRIEKSDGTMEYGISDTKIKSLIDAGKQISVHISKEDELKEEKPVSVALRSHIVAYVMGIGSLLVINLVTGFGYPWFLYPAAGWGIGLANHIASALTRIKQRKEKSDQLTVQQNRVLKKIHRQERGFAGHLTSYLAVNGFLFMIYLLHPTSIIWPLIPAAGWGFGLFMHRVTYSARKSHLLRRLKSTGVTRKALRQKIPADRAPSPKGNIFDSLAAEAVRIRDYLIEQFRSSKQLRSQWGNDLEPLLERYIAQISELNERDQELRRIIGSISVEHLDREIRNMTEKKEKTSSPGLAKEYEKSIQQHRQQLHSYEELSNQREIIELRLKSSVMAIKRLQIEFTRMKGLSASQEQFTLKAIREKSEELSQYLDDLRDGYDEL